MKLEEFCALLSKNNADEADAIEGYFELMAQVDEIDEPGDVKKMLYADIAEIISEEMKHERILSEWIGRLTGIEAEP